MELASRIYDVVTGPENQHADIPRGIVPVQGSHALVYWRQVLRMAALCHDLGHLPFSHAAEDILPANCTHEDLSLALIRSAEMAPLWDRLHLNAEDVGKVAVGTKHYPKPLSDWESLLSEIIGGDAFGADRMDYLLRDSLHAGVSYGHFEHHRLIDTLRILPRHEEDATKPTLGIEQGGLQSAESLVWARYFMYTQIYFHHVRRIYDFHLKQFLGAWLPNGRFGAELKEHQLLTDVEILCAIRAASADPHAPGHEAARRIVKREHFRLVAEITEPDRLVAADAAELLAGELRQEFGPAVVFLDSYTQKSKGIRFPVLSRDGAVEWSTVLSTTLKQVPTFTVEYVFVAPEHVNAARKRVAQFRRRIRETKEEKS